MVHILTNARLKMFMFTFLLIPFLWSQNINARYGEEGLPKKELSKYRFNNSRSEQFELYMVDAYEDGWNGAWVDLYVNGTLVLDDATVEQDFNSIFFDVNSGDVITTVWSEGSYDEECYYGIYNNVGGLVAEAGTDDFPELELSYTVGNLEECSLTEYVVTVDGGNYQSEVYWEFENTNFQTVASGFAPITVEDGFVICLEDGSYGVLMNDSYGDGWNGNVLQLWTLDADGNYVEAFNSTLESGDYGVAQLNVGDGEFSNLVGCTDPTASNLNADAIWDDGSCSYLGQDCSTALTAVEGSNEAMSAPLWYTFTASLTGTATISSVGGGVDTQVYGYSGACDALEQVGFGDDEGGSPEWSSIMIFNITEGMTYYINWTDYWSSEGFTWTFEERLPSPTNLYAEAGLEKTFLYWDPVLQDVNRSYNLNQRYEGTINEYLDHIQNKLNNARVENLNAWQGRTLEELQDHVSSYNRPNSRNTEVFVSLYDSYGDGHDGDAYILMLTEEGGTSDITFGATGYDILEVMSGGWTGYESSYGPFDLDDGSYFIAWNPNASYLGEQSFIIRDYLDGTELAAGEYGTGDPVCFNIGNGDCPSADIAFVNASYNAFTGMATVDIQNIGDLGAGNFFVALSIDDNDVNALVQGAEVFDVINPGDFAEITFDLGSTVPAWLGGFDGEDHDLYFIIDPFGELVGENQDNNYGSLTINNSSPLEDVTWNIYRDEVLVDNVTANWYPGMETYMAIDYVPEGDIEYCYSVTQVTNEIESANSSVSCATPISLPDMVAPTYLTGSVSGYDINLNWEFDSGDGHDGGHGSVVFGSGIQGRQGGNTIEDAVVITQIPAVLTGTTSGYENNTDEVCPYTGSESPDVVYSFTPTEGTVVDLSLCYSSYDTKLYVYDGNYNLVACNDDAGEYPADDCFQWTSFIPDLALSVGETYYIVIDGYSGDFGDYVLDIEPFSAHQGFTIMKEGVPVGTARPDDKSWSTLHWASENTDIEFSVVANYLFPDINEPLLSEPSNTTVVSLTIDDNPNSLNAEVFANNVELNWEQPLSENLQLELALDDGTIWSAWWYAGAVANRYRVNGEYTINAIANQIWMYDWPDDIYGETPYKLSILALDPETDLPGEVLFEQYVTVDAEPESENYGWGMVELFEPLTVSGDVFVMYSDFGYDWSTGYDGSYDMDMMACDEIRDHQNNSYVNFSAPGQEPAWMLSSGQFASCGDWILRMNVDFSSGDGATFSNWINPSGGPELSLDVPILNPEQSVNSKENPVRHNTAFVDPVWPQTGLSRDVMGYNIYRNDNIISETTGLYYQDNYLDWGSYSYHVTALYDDYESDPSNSVNVTLENDPPAGAILVSPPDGIVYTVDELNLNDEIFFLSTLPNDPNNDLIEFMFEASAQVGEETYNIASESLGQNAMYNGSFDGEIYLQDNGWQYHAEGWETYPDANHYTVIMDGENVYNSEATYSLFDGDQAAKMWGNGEENNLFQTWYGELEPGTTIMANAMFYQATDDHIGEDAQMFLVAKYFYADWGWAGMDMSLPFTIDDPMDTWQPRFLVGMVPEGVEIVQVGMMYVGSGGAVAIDDVNLNIPITDPLFFVDMGTLAQPAIDNDLETITWTWDIWASDGWDAVSSENGPFNLTVDLDIAYPTLTLDPVSIDFGLVANEDLLTSEIIVSNTSEEGVLDYNLALIESFDRNSNSMHIADRNKIGHHRSAELNQNSMNPNDNPLGRDDQSFNPTSNTRSTSLLDIVDSIPYAQMHTTGLEVVPDVMTGNDIVYTLDYFNNNIERFDPNHNGITESHEFIIYFGGGSYDEECGIEITKIEFDPDNGEPIYEAVAIIDGGVDELNGQTITLEDGSYRILLMDSYGDGWNGATFSLDYPENGSTYWSFEMVNDGNSNYPMAFVVGNPERAILAMGGAQMSLYGINSEPYGIAYDGYNLWVGSYNSGVHAFNIHYSGNLFHNGSFTPPSGDGYWNAIAWDGYALLMRDAFDEYAPLYIVDFDGSVLAEWPTEEPIISHALAWDNNYGLYASSVNDDGLVLNEILPGEDGNLLIDEDIIVTGYGTEFGYPSQSGIYSYDLDIYNGHLFTKPWQDEYYPGIRGMYIYDFSNNAELPVFSQSGGILEPGSSDYIQFNIRADRPEFNFDIMVYSNDPNAVDAHIPVSYTVEPATILVDPVSISAEPLVTGESSSYQVSIANTGGFDLDYEIDILFPDLVEQSGSIGMIYHKQNSASMALFGPIENRSSGMGQNNQSQTLSRDGHELVIFDGMSVPDYFEEFAWGGADFYISENTGYDEGTNSLIFVQGDPWSGGGFNIFDEGIDLVHLWENNGRLSFDMWSEPNAPTVRFQFESGPDGKMGFWLTAHEEGGWHEYHINLHDFQYVDGTNNFDAHHVNVFQVMAEGNGAYGRTFHIDNVYIEEGDQPWLSQTGGDEFGTVEFGAEPDLAEFTLVADNLASGDYQGDIVIHSNDPANPSLTVPVTVSITALPIAETSTDMVDFGYVRIGSEPTLGFQIWNAGMEVLEISNIVLDDAGGIFSTDMVSMNINPGEEVQVLVSAYPTEPDMYTGSIMFDTNDPNTPAMVVELHAIGEEGPIMVVNPSEIGANLLSYDEATQVLSVENNGPLPLEFNLDLDIGGQDVQEPLVNFTKDDYADWTLAENQDRVTEQVWITRADNQGLFNAYIEDGYNGEGPSDTYWVWGEITWEGFENDEYEWDSWKNAVESSGYNVNQALVEQLDGTPVMGLGVYNDYGNPTIYNVTWESFTGSNSGGGFSYVREHVGTWVDGESNDQQWITITNVDGSNIGSDEGFSVEFAKDDYANYWEESNQDVIHDNVRITRGNYGPIFNAAYQDGENDAQNYGGPLGTSWAIGSFENLNDDEGLYFENFREVLGGDIGNFMNDYLIPSVQPMVMYLEEHNEYYEIQFTSWTCCQDGGGFSYIRTSQAGEEVVVNIVEPNEIAFFNVNLNSGNLDEGSYHATIHVSGNDVLNPHVAVDVTMNVTGFAEIGLSDNAIDFGEIYYGESAYQEINIYNNGTSVLVVDAMNDVSDFELSETYFEIEQGESVDLGVEFIPSGAGEYSDRITIMTNDENNPELSVSLMGVGVAAPIITVSTDSIGAYVPEGDVRTRVFEISNSGESDLFWSIGAPDSDDMRHSIGGLQDYRDQWNASMIQLSGTNQIGNPTNDNNSRSRISGHSQNLGRENRNMLAKNEGRTQNRNVSASISSKTTIFNKNSKFAPANSEYQDGQQVQSSTARSILPPEAHTSRDGHTKIMILPSQNYDQIWSAMDAISYNYGNYDVILLPNYNDIGDTLIYGNEMIQDSIMSHNPDIILVTYNTALWEYDGFLQNELGEYAQNGGHVIYLAVPGDYIGRGLSFVYNWICCEGSIESGPETYNEENPLMMGVGSEYDYIWSYGYGLQEDSQFISVLDSAYLPDNKSMILHEDVGGGKITVLGAGYYEWTDDEAIVLANAVSSQTILVEFEPNNGVVPAGNSLTVTASFNAEIMEKGIYLNHVGIQSNDIVTPVVDMAVGMYVTGDPEMMLLSEGPGMSMSGNELNFGLVHFMTESHVDLMIMNYDSLSMNMSSSFQNDDLAFNIVSGNDMTVPSFDHGMMTLSAQAGLDEMIVTNMLMMETSTSNMEMFVHANMVPRFESIITDISDVNLDQGGWVTVEFTRSFFDGEFGDFGRTEMYTVEINHEGEWTAANSSVAYEDHRYSTLVHTTQDSGSMGDGMTAFRVVAGMDEGTFVGEEAYGYSTDDMAPEAPTGLLTAQTGSDISLSWDAPVVEDFNYFSVYRSESENFETGEDNLIGYTTELTLVDTGATWFTTLYYRLTATDFAGNVGDASDAVEAYVHVNFAPTLSEVDPQSMDEDASYELVLSATDQNEGDVLTYMATSSSSDAMVSVSNDTLSVELTENWFGVAEIEVSVSDGELSDTTLFELTVNSVNDAPEVFGLSSPSDSTIISITPQEISENMTLMVSWDESSDIDGDALTYGFALYNGVYGPDAPVLIDTTLSETMIQIPYQAIAQLIGSLGEMAISGDWTVYATDGVDTTMSDDIYHLTLDASGVLSIDGQMLPEEFALHQNYPNPFNPTTAIRYDLPQSGDVNIMIYDIMGREIRSLVTGHQEAGFRIINWDATNDYGQAISAGMYFYVIQAGEFRETKKMVLLK